MGRHNFHESNKKYCSEQSPVAVVRPFGHTTPTERYGRVNTTLYHAHYSLKNLHFFGSGHLSTRCGHYLEITD